MEDERNGSNKYKRSATAGFVKGFDAFLGGSFVGAVCSIHPILIVHRDMNVRKLMKVKMLVKSSGVSACFLGGYWAYSAVRDHLDGKD